MSRRTELYLLAIKQEAQLRAERDRYREALVKIASYREGAEVNGSFDEPGSATIAREALAPIEASVSA